MRSFSIKPNTPVRLTLVAIVMLLIASRCFSDWQSTLEGVFEKVYTFDNFIDWAGTAMGACSSNSSDMPRLIGNIPTLWAVYCQWQGQTPQEKWIANHPGYVWGGAGKSLCINYARFPDKPGIPKTYGPQSAGLYLGNGDPYSGYNRLYLFFMVKFHTGFFHMVDQNTFYTPGILKFLEFETGFRAPEEWGTTSEQAQTCATPQIRNVYGLNSQIFDLSKNEYDAPNYMGFWDNVCTAVWGGSCYEYTQNTYGSIVDRYWRGINFGPQILANQWIGLEFATDVGVAGQANGSTEIWAYNENGTVVGHQYAGNDVKKRVFNHPINKIVWGVNRIGLLYDEDVADSDENRMYIDDVIINRNRIGPTYFALRAGRQPPAAPRNVTVRE